jgi:hypothetical protein
MSFFAYIDNILRGVSTTDSIELVRAKEYKGSNSVNYSHVAYDISYKKVDEFMFGAITAKADRSDLLSSKELSIEAKKLYESSKITQD